GRENWRNVVVGPVRSDGDTACATLVPDIGHPILFDHPLDHVPGSLLIEACRQTALAMVLTQAPRLMGVSSTFDRFVELDSPAECRAEVIARTGDRTVVR
ncbi:gamma-butyrolactone biosynthesis protein, partial [Nocardia cyriacigeorgica]